MNFRGVYIMKLVRKSSKIRIYPNKEQIEFLELNFKVAREGWNHLVSLDRNDYYKWKANQLIPNANFDTQTNLDKEYTKWKKSNEGYNKSDSRIKNSIIKDLKRAKFLSKGLPKFKNYFKTKPSYTTGQNVKIKDDKLIIPKCKPLKFKGRVLEGDLKVVTISRKNNKYYASCSYENVPVETKPKTNRFLAIDWGEKTFLTTNKEDKYNPPLLKKLHNKVNRLNKKLSKKIKYSNNYNKLKLRIDKIKEKITNITDDWYHKLTTELATNFDCIAIEKLNYKTIHQESKYGVSKLKKVQYKFGFWKELISYKLDWYKDTKLIEINPVNTTKKCSNCNSINDKVLVKLNKNSWLSKSWDRSIRTWKCPNCKSIHDKDVNASNNIYNLAFVPQVVGELKHV